MADADLNEEHLSALEERWEQEPDSRIYLQLAEEYRKHGRHEKAVEVLEQGLERRPRDLSAMVALGRCRLELGELDGAITRLEGVIERDPAHMVANKLLVEAYLQKDDLESARSRLEIYRLLNDRDPEIEQLEARLRDTEAGSMQAEPSQAAVEEQPTHEPEAMLEPQALEPEPTFEPEAMLEPQTLEPEPTYEPEPTLESETKLEAEPEPTRERRIASFPAEAPPPAPGASAPPLVETAASGALFALGGVSSPAPNFDLLWRQTAPPHGSRDLTEPFAGLETGFRVGDDRDPAAIFSLSAGPQAGTATMVVESPPVSAPATEARETTPIEVPISETADEAAPEALPMADQEEPFLAEATTTDPARDPSEEDTLRLPVHRLPSESEEAAELRAADELLEIVKNELLEEAEKEAEEAPVAEAPVAETLGEEALVEETPGEEAELRQTLEPSPSWPQEEGLPEDTAPIALVQEQDEPPLSDDEALATAPDTGAADWSLEDDDTLPFTVPEEEPSPATEPQLLDTAEFSPQEVLAEREAVTDAATASPPEPAAAEDEDTTPIAAVDLEEPFLEEVPVDTPEDVAAAAVGDHDTSPLPAVAEAESPQPMDDEDTTPIEKVAAEPPAAAPASTAGRSVADLAAAAFSATDGRRPAADQESEGDAPAPDTPEVEEKAATATLGQLYLKQGHLHEAERIFKRVLRENPASRAARIGLQQVVRRLEGELTAKELLLEHTAQGNVPEGLTAKKILILEGYLKQLRDMGQSHVQ